MRRVASQSACGFLSANTVICPIFLRSGYVRNQNDFPSLLHQRTLLDFQPKSLHQRDGFVPGPLL